MESRTFSRRQLLRRGVVLGALAASPAALLAACGEDAATPAEGDATSAATGGAATAAAGADTLERVREQGFVRIAFANEPPYSEVAEDGVSVTGAAVEVPRAVLARLGVDELDGVVIAYDAMIPGLQAERFDMVTAGLFMTPERCEQVIYSEPDVCGTESFAVLEGNPGGFASYEDIAAAGAKVGVPGGSVEADYAAEAGVPEGDIVIIPDSRSGIEALQAGRIDAYGLPSLSIKNLLETAEGLEEVGPLDGVPVACAGAAFRPSDEAFRDAYNEALQEVKDSGEFAEILESFGFPSDVALETTAEQLCAGEG
ncbi:MAG: ectoine/hydroxyectoine ABC transporter substrate-binding protein EhuB [Egibacteraceae bacterium]